MSLENSENLSPILPALKAFVSPSSPDWSWERRQWKYQKAMPDTLMSKAIIKQHSFQIDSIQNPQAFSKNRKQLFVLSLEL